MKNTIKLLPLLIVFTTMLFISWNTVDPEAISMLDRVLDIEKKIKMINSSGFANVTSSLKIDHISIRNNENLINIDIITSRPDSSDFMFSGVTKLAGVDFVVL